jgi:predicted nuclease of restriction endonuclease-like RecB superfamily
LLTSDLVRVRRRSGLVVPRWLDPATRERVRPVVAALVGLTESMIGASRDEVQAALGAVPFRAQDRLVALGFRKLIDDRTTYEVTAGVDPEALRREVFLAASARHRALGVRDAFDRDAVLAEVAPRLGLATDALEAGLYADLRGAERLVRVDPLDVDELLARYDVALAQAMLLRATRVGVRVEGESPAAYRRLFRAARFHGLIHTVEGSAEAGYTLVLDGPFSLFDAVQKYGLRLAVFLPHVLACKRFALRAELVWGRSREHVAFELSHEDGLRSHVEELPALTPELEAFRAAFDKLGSPWKLAENRRIFALPKGQVCVPDLVFSREGAEDVYLEAFGFWSREAVWRRVELVREGFPARLILAVGKHLRVSEEVLDEDDAGELYVYKATMSPRAILERLERPRGR